jgi:hypothetical protein
MRSAQSLRLSGRQYQSEVGSPGPDNAADTPADERVEIAAERSRYDARVHWPKSNASGRSSKFESDRLMSKSPGIGKRLLRAIFRFSLLILIGVVATLSWQSYGDEMQDTVRTWAPSLDWLIPPATTKSATANARSAEVAEQLKPIALDLAVVRKAVEELAANQEQLAAKDVEIAQSIAALQATEQGLGDKISSLPAAKTAHAPPRRAAQHPPQPLNVQ